MVTRDDIALKIFCAFLARPDAKVTPYPNLGENEVRVSFRLADTFLMVRKEHRKKPHEEHDPR